MTDTISMSSGQSSESNPPKIGRQTLIVIFTALLVVAVNAFWWVYYERTRDNFAAQLDARLRSLAISGSALFSPDEVDSLAAGDIEQYLRALDYLSVLGGADSVSEVFMLDFEYGVIASSRADADTFYLLAELNGAALSGVFDSDMDAPLAHGALVTESYQAGGVILKSAFAPLYGADGAPLAAIGVEADVNYTETLAQLKANLILSSGVSVLAALIFAGFFLLIQRRVTFAERSALRHQSEMNLGRMVAVVSHEIKNPLTILRAAGERLRKKTELTEADFIIEEVDRLNKIVTGYLDFARSPDKVTLQYVDLDRALTELRELCGQLRPRLLNDRVTFTTVIPPSAAGASEHLSGDNHALLIDSAALRQVTLNLILNASQAARTAAAQGRTEGGEAETRLSVELAEQIFQIHVFDNGLGIADKELRRLFEPFYTTKQQGSGLGLYLCRTLVERMKGKITVDSSDGGPTKFSVSLPISQNPGAKSSAPKSSAKISTLASVTTEATGKEAE
ncbi:MAG: PAS domain-containing sensor histidine kinase [Candidatus Zixiibacteriota bacterium]